jgi:hypothetical protein
MADYSEMTDDDFDRILENLVSNMTAEQILAIGDVNTILREELNNAVLEVWDMISWSFSRLTDEV